MAAEEMGREREAEADFSQKDSLLNKDLSVEEITSKDFNGYGEYEVVNINVETEDVYFAADVLSHNKGTNSI